VDNPESDAADLGARACSAALGKWGVASLVTFVVPRGFRTVDPPSEPGKG